MDVIIFLLLFRIEGRRKKKEEENELPESQNLPFGNLIYSYLTYVFDIK